MLKRSPAAARLGRPRRQILLSNFFAKIRIHDIRLPTREIEGRVCATAGGEAKGDGNFSYFFHRNPLKSPDSDE
jgi:hypothetical protein